MEVQDRPLLAPRRLNERFAVVWAWRWPALALATVVTVAALVVDAQPLRSPWWTYADADASYTASALNLMLGEDVSFVDHPGLPITEAVAIAFAVETLFDSGSVGHDARVRKTDATLLDLDAARGTFRGFAVAFYVLGAVLSFALAARMFRHWTWGLAAGLLWIAAPGLIPMSIQLRPDVLLSALCVAFAFAVGRAVERRTLPWYAAAGVLVGFAAMVKLHALALVPALALAALWRPAAAGEAAAGLVPRTRRDRGIAGIALGAIAVAAVALNAFRLPYSLTDGQVLMLAGLVAAAAAFAAVGAAPTRVRSLARLRGLGRTIAAAGLGVVGGIAVPVVVSVPEGLRALVYVATNISGRGVQEGVDSFATPFSNLEAIVGQRTVFFFLLVAGAATVGALRRDARPVVWAVAALAMGVMAFARPPNVHYFAPSFVLGAFALLWLVGGVRGARASLLVWPVVLFFAWPAWDGRRVAAQEQERFAASVVPAKALVDARLREGEVAIVPSYWPFADARYFELVEIYVDHKPLYPYRYLPATANVRGFARLRGYRPRYYVGPIESGAQTRVQLGDLGEYLVAPVDGGKGLVSELIQGPGITESW